MNPIILALHLIRLTGLDNQVILVNPDQVVELREPRDHGHFHGAVKCLVFTSNGKHTPVIETCEEVRIKIEEMRGRL